MKIKEIYSAPQTLFQEIEAINLVCGSGEVPGVNGDNNTIEGSGEFAPRRFYV